MRIKRLLVAPDFLLQMTSGAFQVILNAPPSDARIHQTTIDPCSGCICLFVTSESFPDLAEGFIPPLMEGPTFLRLCADVCTERED